ncbi:MAG: hypothetical protein WA030_04335 [Candidatus Microsaccharimonas sp.]
MSEKPPLHITERGKNVIWGTAAATAIAAGITGIVVESGGNNNGPERGEVDTSIFSITLTPDANLRYDPNLGDVNTNTLIAQPGQETEVIGQSRIRVLEGTDDGTWYGLSTDWLADSIPHFDDNGDKDGIVWVNEQGVSHVTHLEDIDIQLPTLPDQNSKEVNN